MLARIRVGPARSPWTAMGALSVSGKRIALGGGTRTVTHAAIASVELSMQRPGNRELTLSSSRAAYEYGARQPTPGIVPQPLPEG